jgi:GT2 family glycosyltransferase
LTEAAEKRLPEGVDVVIVNWNTARRTVASARGFNASDGVRPRVIVVDNDSVPPEQALLRDAAGDGFELVEAGRNLGFGAAANLGVFRGSSPYVAVSNADVLPEPGALQELVRVCRENPQAGMVGPVFADGGNIYHDHLPGPLVLLARALAGGFRRQRIDPPPAGQVARVEQPSGACFVMSRAVWKSCGGFDDRFFLWYEDVDLARRLHDSGKTGLVAGGALVTHIGGESFARLDPVEKQNLRLDSLSLYLRLHHPVAAILSKPLIFLGRRLRLGRLKR